MPQATWYFGYLSPYAYLQFHRFGELPPDLEVTIKPVVFGALLQHHGQLGPADALIDKSLALNPRNAHGAHVRAHIHYEAGENDTGVRYLED